MKLLVIGSGGREHALVWKLAQSPRVTELWCAPGSDAIGEERLASNGTFVGCLSIGADKIDALRNFARANRADLTVVGPDNTLGLGIVDLFHESGLNILGPNLMGAGFETSKAHTQGFAERHGISIARGRCFQSVEDARMYARSFNGRCVVKADGLALGKGAIVCGSVEEADTAITRIMVNSEFGHAGQLIVIQERLLGREFSLHAICDGSRYKLFPTSQDHKRALDGDRGPNTGGMGAYSPVPFITPAIVASAEELILKPWQAGCLKDGILFRGILYPGVMLTPDGTPKTLEFNGRFGDPETQVYLTRLKSDLVELLWASATGSLNDVTLEWEEDLTSVCVVMASGGYPGSYEKGKLISGLEEVAQMPNVKVFHAGTKRIGSQYVTNGGRVLGVTARAKGLEEARYLAYEAVYKISFDGAHYRTDIAAQGLSSIQ